MTEDSKEVSYTKLVDAIDHLEKQQTNTHESIALFSKNFEEFTGYKPDHRVSAFDVVRLFHRFKGGLQESD